MPLHHGTVPAWLYERMRKLGGAIIEAIVTDYGKNEVLRRLSDPLWFQSLGCVLGMDWHSSGITTSVIGALKSAINPISNELGIYICGGRGRYSRKTPEELLKIAGKTGLDGHLLVNNSKLTAKVDNNAVQDGFQLYLHSFIVTTEGEWSVVQQGLNAQTGMARRYHWHSQMVESFTEEPHAAVCGENMGMILNLTSKNAGNTRNGILSLSSEKPSSIIRETQKIIMPVHHEVRAKDVNLKRLGTILSLARDKGINNFESLLLLEGLGPKTLQSLTLVSEVIHGTPSRFSDPARFSFAHGGKDGHPYPVPIKTYDETIHLLSDAIQKAKIGHADKKKAIDKLHSIAKQQEKKFVPDPSKFDEYVAKENREAYQYGGRTVFGKAKHPGKASGKQLKLF